MSQQEPPQQQQQPTQPQPKTKQPKSILKKPTQTPDLSSHPHPTEVVWDEKNLQHNDEERIAAGPRMKIEEPKTPYHESIHPSHPDFEDDFSLGPPLTQIAHSNMIQNAVMLTDNLVEESSEEEDDRFEGMDAEEIAKHKKFEQMRNQHYKMEFKKATNPLSKPIGANDDDDDESSDYEDE